MYYYFITKFYTKKDEVNSNQVFDVIVYIGKVTDKQYAGPAPVEEIAKTILTSIGPSGPNKDYLYNLADALRDMNIADDHVYEIEEAVKLLDTLKNS